MTRTFIQTHEFSKRWDSLGYDDDDLRILELDIMVRYLAKRKRIIYPSRREMPSRK